MCHAAGLSIIVEGQVVLDHRPISHCGLLAAFASQWVMEQVVSGLIW